jgi:hypothetical protein
MKRLVLVLFFVLVLILAWVMGGSITSPPTLARENPPGETLSDGTDRFPFRCREMDSSREMFARLCAESPRKRSKYENHDVVLLRAPDDYFRVDGLADHYTEQLRVTQTPAGSHLPSPWDVWRSAGYRTHIQEHAGSDTPLAFRRKLEEFSPPVVDTNPVFVCWLLRRIARQMRIKTYQMRVMDGNCGWGGQTLGACAADVKCYHGYLPFPGPLRASHAQQLLLLLQENISSEMPENEFWVRQMSPPMAPGSGTKYYDVLILHVSDLGPFTPELLGSSSDAKSVGDAWNCVRPGGSIVLFVGSGRRAMSRALAVLQSSRSRGAPQLYAVREYVNGSKSYSRALVWSKIEHS